MKLEDLGDVNEHDEIKEPIMFNQDSSDLQINQKSLVHSSENETQSPRIFVAVNQAPTAKKLLLLDLSNSWNTLNIKK